MVIFVMVSDMFKLARLFLLTLFVFCNLPSASQVGDIRVTEGDEREAFEEVFLDEYNLSPKEKELIRGHHKKIQDHHEKLVGKGYDLKVIHAAKHRDGSLETAITFKGNKNDSNMGFAGDFTYQAKISKGGPEYKRFGLPLNTVNKIKKNISDYSFYRGNQKKLEKINGILEDDQSRKSDRAFKKALKQIAGNMRSDMVGYDENSKSQKALRDHYIKITGALNEFSANQESEQYIRNNIHSSGYERDTFGDRIPVFFNRDGERLDKDGYRIDKRGIRITETIKQGQRNSREARKRADSEYNEYKGIFKKHFSSLKKKHDGLEVKKGDFQSKFLGKWKKIHIERPKTTPGIPLNNFFERDVAAPSKQQSFAPGDHTPAEPAGSQKTKSTKRDTRGKPKAATPAEEEKSSGANTTKGKPVEDVLTGHSDSGSAKKEEKKGFWDSIWESTFGSSEETADTKKAESKSKTEASGHPRGIGPQDTPKEQKTSEKSSWYNPFSWFNPEVQYEKPSQGGTRTDGRSKLGNDAASGVPVPNALPRGTDENSSTQKEKERAEHNKKAKAEKKRRAQQQKQKDEAEKKRRAQQQKQKDEAEKKRRAQQKKKSTEDTKKSTHESKKKEDLVNKSWRKDNFLNRSTKRGSGWVSDDTEETVDGANDALINH